MQRAERAEPWVSDLCFHRPVLTGGREAWADVLSPVKTGSDLDVAATQGYAAEGLGAGSAVDGFAFRGQNPNFRGMGIIQPIGLSLYNALTVGLRGRMIKSRGPVKEMTGNVSYALSRFQATSGDQDFVTGSPFNDAPTKFFGPAGLDRTHQLSFSFLTELPLGFPAEHYYSPRLSFVAVSFY